MSTNTNTNTNTNTSADAGTAMHANAAAESRAERIRGALQAALAPDQLEVGDDSALHAGHAGAASGGGHYSVKIVSSRFEGLRLVMRHRLVYDAVHDMMRAEIHALAITALAPSELN